MKRKVSAPGKPTFFDQNLRLLGGSNPLGEPRLRVSWGWDLRTFRNGDPQALKYPSFLERWILEQWVVPEFFGSRKQWEINRYIKTADGMSLDLLGDYPSRGSYIFVMAFENSNNEYVPLTDDALVAVDMLRHHFEKRVEGQFSSAKAYAQVQQEAEMERVRQESETEKRVEEFTDHLRIHEDEINKDVIYSKNVNEGRLTLWTPDGEHNLN